MSWNILSKTNLQYLLTRLKEVTDSITRGHGIKNASGLSMTQRNGLEFSDAHVSDDSTNDKTIVDVIKETSNISNETEEGFYFDTSKPEAVINAEQVAFNNAGTSYTSDDVDGVLREMVVNNLTSTATDKALSAYQGKLLNDTKVNKETDKKLIYAFTRNIAASGSSVSIPSSYLPIDVCCANNATSYNWYRVAPNDATNLSVMKLFETNAAGVALSFAYNQDKSQVIISNSGAWGSKLYITGLGL